MRKSLRVNQAFPVDRCAAALISSMAERTGPMRSRVSALIDFCARSQESVGVPFGWQADMVQHHKGSADQRCRGALSSSFRYASSRRPAVTRCPAVGAHATRARSAVDPRRMVVVINSDISATGAFAASPILHRAACASILMRARDGVGRGPAASYRPGLLRS